MSEEKIREIEKKFKENAIKRETERILKFFKALKVKKKWDSKYVEGCYYYIGRTGNISSFEQLVEEEENGTRAFNYIESKTPNNKYFYILKDKKFIGYLVGIILFENFNEFQLIESVVTDIHCLNINQGDNIDDQLCYCLKFEKLDDISSERNEKIEVNPREYQYLNKNIEKKLLEKCFKEIPEKNRKKVNL